MAEPILFQVGIEGQDDILKVAEAIGEGLGAAFSKPNADIARLNASINSLAATITKLGAASTDTADQVKGVAEASTAFDAVTDSVNQFQASLNASAEAAEKLGENFTHLGEQSKEAGKHIHAMGEAGGAAAASFKLLQTSVTGAVELLTGGGLRAGVELIKGIGEGVESTGKHFGALGEKIAAFVERSALVAGVLGAAGISLKDLADHSKEDTLEIHSLAEAMGVSTAEFLQLKSSLSDVGIGMDELAVTIRTVSVRMQNEWAAIQRAVRDATLPIIQDQLAIQAAMRATEEAQIGVREAAINTAAAERELGEAQASADRAAAEAQISASEAVINQKEAEFDAQNKLADAQRAYADAVVNANEAQLNLADAQKDFQYQGDDAWRTMKDAIDAVADAERKAADEANAVQEALLSVDEAATSVKGAYVSLYAAQIAYREAHGERVSRAERAELRREQTEVGLESAQERVRGAEFQAAKTRRDAVPEAIERQERAERGVGAAKEAEDKAQQRYAESSQRAGDKLEKSGSAAAAALEHVAKAGLEVQLAPQRATNETAKAALAVEDALANVRKTQFDATHALERAEDNLLSARLKEKAATDQVVAADAALTAANNKAVDDLNANINAVRQFITTGRGPAGFDIRQTPPGVVAQAAEYQAGGPGHMLQEIDLLQKAFQAARIPFEQWASVMTAVGVPRQVLTPGGEFQRRFDPRYRGTEEGRPIVEVPTTAQRDEAKAIEGRVKNAQELDLAEKRVISAYNKLADQYGAALIPGATEAAKFTAQHPIEAVGLAVTAAAFTAGVATIASTTAEWGKNIVAAILGVGVGGGALSTLRNLFSKGGAAATEGMVIEGGFSKGPMWPGGTGNAAAGEVEALAKAASTLETEALAAKTGVAAVAAELGTAETTLGGFALALGALSAPILAIEGIIAFLITQIPRMIQEEKTGPHAADIPAAIGALLHGGSLADAQAAATGQGAKPAQAESPFKRTGLTGVDETPLPPAFVPPAQRQQAQPVAAPEPEPVAAPETSAKLDQVVQKLDVLTSKIAEPKTDDTISQKLIDLTDKITESKEHEAASSAEVGGDKMNVAADKLEEAATKLEEAAGKISLGGGGEVGAPATGERTAEGAKDAIDKIKDSIDKLVGGKGLIQPPTDPKDRASYDSDVRQLLESVTQVNNAEKGLIDEQTRATAESENLTKKQEELTQANTQEVKQKTQDEAKLNEAKVNQIGQQTEDGHEIALAQEALIQAQTDRVNAETQSVINKQPVAGHAAGGPVVGPGGVDKVPIMATSGEYVVNAPQTAKHRSLLDSINEGGELRFQLGGYVGGLNPGLAHEPSTGALQSALTSNIGMGPGGYMMAKMQSQSTQSYAVDLRTDHGTYTVLATEDQMGAMLQGSIAQKIASTGPKPSWWS